MDNEEIFYVAPEDVSAEDIILRKEELHHIKNVYRKKRGDHFLAVDGMATAYDCEIASFNKNILHAKIIKKRRNLGEPLFKLTLAVALIKKTRFEWLIEKATEIGVCRFVPLLTERTILNKESLKLPRCRKIALSAMKQSRRSFLPVIEEPISLASAFENSFSFPLKLIAHEKESGEDLHLKSIEQPDAINVKSGILCIGPEGGFTDDEIQLAKTHGFAVVGLGPRRLRSETAALVGSALILERMNELN